jgi:hypothetical protein
VNPGPQLSGYVSEFASRSLFLPLFFLVALQNVRRSAETARPSVLPLLPIRTTLRLKIFPTPHGGHNACSIADDDSR